MTVTSVVTNPDGSVTTTYEGCDECCDPCPDLERLCNGYVLAPGYWRATVTAAANWVRYRGNDTPVGGACEGIDPTGWCAEVGRCQPGLSVSLEPPGNVFGGPSLGVSVPCCSTAGGPSDPTGIQVGSAGANEIGGAVPFLPGGGSSCASPYSTSCYPPPAGRDALGAASTTLVVGGGVVTRITSSFEVSVGYRGGPLGSAYGLSPRPSMTVVWEPGRCAGPAGGDDTLPGGGGPEFGGEFGGEM